MTTAAPVKTPQAAIQVEAWFEWSASLKETTSKGPRRIYDPDSEAWSVEIESSQTGKGGDVSGMFRVAEVTRVDGEIVRIREQQNLPCFWRQAQERLRLFKASGGSQFYEPWHADRAAEVTRLQNEGRVIEARTLAETVAKAVREAMSVPAPTTPAKN